MLWRYDPILICNLVDVDEHVRRFNRLASVLQGRTRRVTVSYATFYRKTVKNLGRIKGLHCFDVTKNAEMMHELISRMARIAQSHNMELSTCATDIDLAEFGVRHGKCIDDHLLHQCFSLQYASCKDKGQRASCRCVKSIDIGQYNTCLHKCAYCYATDDINLAKDNNGRHDPLSPLLVGQPPEPSPDNRPWQLSLL